MVDPTDVQDELLEHDVGSEKSVQMELRQTPPFGACAVGDVEYCQTQGA